MNFADFWESLRKAWEDCSNPEDPDARRALQQALSDSAPPPASAPRLRDRMHDQ